MLYWILWIVGILCMVFSAILLYNEEKVVYYIIAGIGIFLGFGTLAGRFIGYYIGLNDIGSCVIGAIIIFVVEYGLYYWFYEEWAGIDIFHNIFSIISIIILISGTIVFSFSGYISGHEKLEYNNNIEVMEPSSGPAWSHEYELLSFNNVPVQKISGELSGEMNSNIFYGEGEISGSITTTDEIAYWFINKDGKGQYHTISPSVCYIIPVEDNVTPYVKVVTYRETQKTIDHNIEEESVEVLSEWKVYEFYIPKSLIK